MCGVCVVHATKVQKQCAAESSVKIDVCVGAASVNDKIMNPPIDKSIVQVKRSVLQCCVTSVDKK